ncbi:MAG: lipopolysaccharide biosynthesis protein [Roseiflexus castenholzii]|nr:MAG: lipopolysaccharide biosynthesis protein [Roseiflexus castenholzii]
MQLSDYLAVLRRRWWIILLTTVVAVASALIFSRLRVYRSEASYLVVPNRIDNGLSIVLQNSMSSFREMALARPQLQKISDELQLDRTPEWLLKRVAIQPRPDERKMIVQVDYPDPATAQRLADAIGNNMVALVSARNNFLEGTDRISMTVLEPATPPVLHRPQTRVNMLAGAALGLVLGILLAFVLEALDDTIKTPDDVERHVQLATLGAIPATGSDTRSAALPARR